MPECARDVLSYIEERGGHASRAEMTDYFGGRYDLEGMAWLEAFRYVVVFYDDVYVYHGERF